MAQPRIFVGIASYRDTECQWTVRDLFAKATHPDRIAVGICWQFFADSDQDCFQIETRPDQVRVIEIDAAASLGVCWARQQVQSLWRGEEYVLQIDSHMRFVEGWDEAILETLARCDLPRAVLTAYPPPYVPPDKVEGDHVILFNGAQFTPEGILEANRLKVMLSSPPPAPVRSFVCSAAFVFGPSAIIADVPYDPHIYFYGEEVTLAVRLWTSGWDLFAPDRIICFHDYTARPRPRHWRDNRSWGDLQLRSERRVRHLLGMETTDDPAALVEIDRYGLGTARSLTAYEATTRIDFKNRLIDGKTRAEHDLAATPELRRARAGRVFGEIWQFARWGKGETRSGSGATLAGSAAVLAALPGVFRELGIEILADAGCGELNWMGRISEALRLYLGFDIVPGVVADLAAKHGLRPGHLFSVLDVTVDRLPRSDAILCRDLLTHYPPPFVAATLALFKESGSRYLISTSHEGGANGSIPMGGWQPCDLTAAPYNLPPPLIRIGEGADAPKKHLGVWRLADLP